MFHVGGGRLARFVVIGGGGSGSGGGSGNRSGGV